MMRKGGSKFGIDLVTQANNEVCLGHPGPPFLCIMALPLAYPRGKLPDQRGDDGDEVGDHGDGGAAESLEI